MAQNMRTKANLPICKRFVKPHVAAGHESSDGYSTTLSPPMVPDPRKPSFELINYRLQPFAIMPAMYKGK